MRSTDSNKSRFFTRILPELAAGTPGCRRHGELGAPSVAEKFSVTAADGKKQIKNRETA